MLPINTYADFIRAANEMQRQRDIKECAPLPNPDCFEQSFNEIFVGDEAQVKQVNTGQAMWDAGHKHSDF